MRKNATSIRRLMTVNFRMFRTQLRTVERHLTAVEDPLVTSFIDMTPNTVCLRFRQRLFCFHPFSSSRGVLGIFKHCLDQTVVFLSIVGPALPAVHVCQSLKQLPS